VPIEHDAVVLQPQQPGEIWASTLLLRQNPEKFHHRWSQTYSAQNGLISKRSTADGATLARVATGDITGVPFGVKVLSCCVRWGWLKMKA
jgi:hypothetical protein